MQITTKRHKIPAKRQNKHWEMQNNPQKTQNDNKKRQMTKQWHKTTTNTQNEQQKDTTRITALQSYAFANQWRSLHVNKKFI